MRWSTSIINSLKKAKSAVRKSVSTDGECQKTLSSLTELNAFSQLWTRHADAVLMVAQLELLNYVQKNSVSKKEIDAFKLGLAAFPSFMEKAEKEAQALKLQDTPE